MKLLTKPTELTPVEDDPEVVARREAYETFLARKATLEAEWRELGLTLNPNTASWDHRPEVPVAERIHGEERVKALVPLIRLATADIPPAAEALAAARRHAYTVRYAACRVRVAAKLARFYDALEQLAAGAHAELVRECEEMNALLKSPGGGALPMPLPPPFDLLMLAWPELREDADGPVTQRRKYLEKDGWLADD